MLTPYTLLVVFLCQVFASAMGITCAELVRDQRPVYEVTRLRGAMSIDGNWHKEQWQNVESITVDNFIREDPKFRPIVQAKLMYDEQNIYVLFRVKDQYVRSITTEINGPVWKDSAVEFFFAPDIAAPEQYFNLEINGGGTPLLGYRPNRPSTEDIKSIEIAHSLPEVVDPELGEPVTWTIECRIPLAMLAKYAHVVQPAPGVQWRGNFYKIAENNSNPHHATWALIDAPNPTFHLPQYFGVLRFQ